MQFLNFLFIFTIGIFIILASEGVFKYIASYSGLCNFSVFRGHDAKYVHVVQKPNFNPNIIGVHNPSTAQYNKDNPSLNDINHGVSSTDTAPRILNVLTVL